MKLGWIATLSTERHPIEIRGLGFIDFEDTSPLEIPT